MKIRAIEAIWLRCPLPEERQHTSDFGRLRTFDGVLVRVEADDGAVGWGEAKSAVGSAGHCAALVTCIEQELAPALIGEDSGAITKLWERMHNAERAHYALQHGRPFSRLGRRGLHVAAIGGIDIALWDLLGKRLSVPVASLLGGACRDSLPAYASGGWADADGIGAELSSYVDQGFAAVKMRAGVMDGAVATSVARVRRAREALPPTVALMVDAHGTFSVPEAKQFCRATEELGLRWLEEPVASDDRRGAAAVRAATGTPIAYGESESTRFDVLELIEHRAVDVLQPDAAIVGGITEMQRIAALASAHRLQLAPHLWGGAACTAAGVHVAFASPSAVTLEFGMGANPLLHDLIEEDWTPVDGRVPAPTRPGLGITPREEFVAAHRVEG